jgi:hypothetical protein
MNIAVGDGTASCPVLEKLLIEGMRRLLLKMTLLLSA